MILGFVISVASTSLENEVKKQGFESKTKSGHIFQ